MICILSWFYKRPCRGEKLVYSVILVERGVRPPCRQIVVREWGKEGLHSWRTVGQGKLVGACLKCVWQAARYKWKLLVEPDFDGRDLALDRVFEFKHDILRLFRGADDVNVLRVMDLDLGSCAVNGNGVGGNGLSLVELVMDVARHHGRIAVNQLSAAEEGPFRWVLDFDVEGCFHDRCILSAPQAYQS